MTLSEVQFNDIEQDIVRKEEERERRRERLKSGEASLEESELTVMKQETEESEWEMTGDRATTPTENSSVSFYRFLVYALIKLRQFLLFAWHLFWRFFELHTSKLIVVTIFAYGLYEPSATYFFAIVVAVVIAPLPFLNPIVYPLLTIYYGVLSVSKYIFQFPIISSFNYNDYCNVSITLSSSFVF